jgi:hypothetical protein
MAVGEIETIASGLKKGLTRFVNFRQANLPCQMYPLAQTPQMKVSSEQAPRYQPRSKHLRDWTGKDEASVGESDPQRLKPHPPQAWSIASLLSLACACIKMLQVGLSRKQKFEKRFALKAACLSDAEESQVCMRGSIIQRTFGYISLDGKGPYGSFRRVIVPRDTIFSQESKQTILISNKPFLIRQNQV